MKRQIVFLLFLITIKQVLLLKHVMHLYDYLILISVALSFTRKYKSITIGNTTYV